MQRLWPVESQALQSAFSGREKGMMMTIGNVSIKTREIYTCIEKGREYVTYIDIGLSFVINIRFSDQERKGFIRNPAKNIKIMFLLFYSDINIIG